MLALAVAAGTVTACRGCGTGPTDSQSSETPSSASPTASGNVSISNRGPGTRRQPANSLKLPVPRTFDLTHVEPQHFAAALGNDPTRIFNWVRDEIAYEVYSGCLRGPRGTLLAMAGNSVDRATLVAALLRASGHRVRFARGTLPEVTAEELVRSIWARRPPLMMDTPARDAASRFSAAAKTLVAATRRDYAAIHQKLREAGRQLGTTPESTLEQLVDEARAHYWVQWLRDGTWTDLDPLFSDSAIGQTYTHADETPDALNEDLFHHVELRVTLEEYTGDQTSTRTILTLRNRAADLSGVDLVLSHQPENWQAPATSVQAALAAALSSTGRIKPVLLSAGGQLRAGEPFAPKLKTTGIGSIDVLLGGGGTPQTATLATAEYVDVDFIGPNGSRATVRRELFDLVGRTRRAAGQRLTADDVRQRTEAPNAPDMANAIFDLFFTTGRVDVHHLAAASATPPSGGQRVSDLQIALRRVNVAFTIASDAMLQRLERPADAIVVFYPDAPRLLITAITKDRAGRRLALDLRQTEARAVALGPHPEAAAEARLFKGILEGTIERVLVEAVVGDQTQTTELASSLSTSALMERATAEGVPILLLPRDVGQLKQTADDALTRLREDADAAGTSLVLVPQRGIDLDGTTRLAWWKIDSRTGTTVAVTDDGLHGEYIYVNRQGNVLVVVDDELVVHRLVQGTEEMAKDGLETLLRQGVKELSNPINPGLPGPPLGWAM